MAMFVAQAYHYLRAPVGTEAKKDSIFWQTYERAVVCSDDVFIFESSSPTDEAELSAQVFWANCLVPFRQQA